MSGLNTRDWNVLQGQYDALMAEELTTKNVEEWLERWSDLEAAITEDSGNASSRANENTADPEAEALHLYYVREIMPKMQIAHERMKAKLLSLADYIPPQSYNVMMQRFRTGQRLFREDNLPLQTEVNVLTNDYRKTVAQMQIEWKGNSLTLNQAELLLKASEREEREWSWRLAHARWLQDRQTLNELYLKMLALRQEIARNAGFDNYRSYAWLERHRYDYEPADAFTFHDAIEREVVPLARRLYEKRRDDLQLRALRPWDLDVETSDAPPLVPFRSADELEEGGARIFNAVDPALGEQFAQLRDGYLDLESRPNKAPGGYCRALPVSKRSYIFMNAAGTHRNVQTLIHEGGHAFHNHHSFHLPLIWLRRSPMEMAEVASMAMELLAMPYLERDRGGFYDSQEATRARVEHLEKIVFFLPYMAVVDAFQHWVYTEAPQNVGADELDAKWSSLWDRFMIGIDYTGLLDVKETGWHRKQHIFTSPFYYIEYGLAQVGALQIWRNALQDQAAALSAYRQALALGGTRPLPELYETAGARFTFDRKTLRELMLLIEDKLAELR